MTVTFSRTIGRRVAAILAFVPLVVACGSAASSPSASPTAAPTFQSLLPVPSYVLGPSPSGCPTAAPSAMPSGKTATVVLHTSMGDITIKIEAGLGPNAAGNFEELAKCGYYNNVIWHRVVPSFVIQAGDGQYGRLPMTNSNAPHLGEGGPGYTIKDDPIVGDYTRGTVAMANTGTANTAGSQFFIMTNDNPTLKSNGSYSIFGHVTQGMDVVDKIAKIATGGSASGYVAVQIVPIETVTVTEP